MTPTLSTQNAKWCEQVNHTLNSSGQMAHLTWSELGQISLFPGCHLADPELVVPAEWLPTGPLRRRASRTKDPTLGGVLFKGVPARVGAQREENVRRAILALRLPHRTKTGVRVYSPSSWLLKTGRLLFAARWLVCNLPTDDGSVFRPLRDSASVIIKRMSSSQSVRTELESIFNILNDAAERGIVQDLRSHVPVASATPVQFNVEPPHRKPSTEPTNHEAEGEIEEKKKPFNDVFVTEFLRRAMWLQDHLAIPAIECWETLEGIASAAAHLPGGTSNPKIVADRKRAIRDHGWRDALGRHLAALPFPIHQRIGAKFRLSRAWPPSDARSLNLLIGVIQALNFATMAFCTGARHGELEAAKVQLLDASSSERLQSQTYKTVNVIGGASRDWPLHPVAVRALYVQERLAAVIKPTGADHLWVQFNESADQQRGGPLANMTEPLVSAIEFLGLEELAEGRAHSHRWRHTVARIIAITVTGAPKVLLDLFGHRDLEMTLHYMLSDPNIASEAMQFAAEASFAMAEQAIREVLSGTAGGPTASALHQGLDDLSRERGLAELGVEEVHETARTLTFDGKFWIGVAPGVLCTKTLGQFGPCTRRKGEPDPAKCKTVCDHRLELALAKAACRRKLLQMLDDYAVAELGGLTMKMENLEGMILAELLRWDEVRWDVLAQSIQARAIWERAK
jgi:integrase